ncbi:adenylate/guanylate cyclase domain-containing protein [Mycolicibacterium chitae]|uniref:Family 3 adenylate cyclase n=1 Tax=Mycolicibacterium chitae TaxID=1792 RepID=A0A448I2S9_MYCCI|nr:adenylate/guanylate cyclase domain-containing protein [Mycolicibacterium chitae]MCV7104419.1 adenylate/guanylate cyclase domain-containing protein [Mycolicibacterium chitae]BBZ03292.1 adenylate/guanylate cyclase domain-containing protein [Mycolicibacterium chitae]VEG46692.1 family 3 adenylate cyclase [Mycolicibacterium chitae]
MHGTLSTVQVDPRIEASGLLDGLDGSARAERAELISWMLTEGFSVEHLRGSFSPMLLASRRLIGDDATYVSIRQIAEQTGMEIDLVRRALRAFGLPNVDDPDEQVYLRADGAALMHTARFLEMGFDAEDLLHATRILSEGLSNAAEVMRYAALAAVLKPGATELDIARGTEQVVSQAAPLLGPMIEDMLLVALRHAMETEAVNASERVSGTPLPGARMIAVAFADLVGFTRLGEDVEPAELERLAHRLAMMARDVAQPPVRFVKAIGDAVMLVCPEPEPLLRALLDLAGAAEADAEFPRLRLGMSYGEAVSRAGDWFGGSVNLASRVTGAARPGAVLVAEQAQEAIGDVDGIRWSFVGARHLKGIRGDTKLFRARPAD